MIDHFPQEIKRKSIAHLLLYGSGMSPADYPQLSADQARRRDRGRRLARRLGRYAPWLLAPLLDMLAEPLECLVREEKGGRRG